MIKGLINQGTRIIKFSSKVVFGLMFSLTVLAKNNLQDYSLEKNKKDLAKKILTYYPPGIKDAGRSCIEMAYPQIKGPIVFYPSIGDVNKEVAELDPQSPKYNKLITFFKRSVLSSFDKIHLRLLLSKSFFLEDPTTMNQIELDQYAGQLLAVLISYENLLKMNISLVNNELSSINKKLTQFVLSHVDITEKNKEEFEMLKRKQSLLSLELKIANSLVSDLKGLTLNGSIPREEYVENFGRFSNGNTVSIPSKDPVYIVVNTQMKEGKKSLMAIKQAQNLFTRFEMLPMITLDKDFQPVKAAKRQGDIKRSSQRYYNAMPFVFNEIAEEPIIDINTEIKMSLFEDLMNLTAGQATSIYSIIGMDMFDEPDSMRDYIENLCQILK